MSVEIKIKGIKVTGPFMDNSGYGEGCRFWARALVDAGVPISGKVVSFEKDRPDFPDMIEVSGQSMPEKQFLEGICSNKMPCDVNFVRLSPEIAINLLDPNMINVCSCAWECSALDPHWVDCCNRFDAVFVESEWLVNVFRDSGVKAPVYCVPNGVYANNYKVKLEPNLGNTYSFYSIAQWTERKNCLSLLKAYYNAFSPEDDVMLVLKTYMTRVEQDAKQADVIKEQINNLKRSLNFIKPYPPLYLITDKMTSKQIISLHEDCDCYVSLDRGEGFGLPLIQAAAAGNPVINTDWGGSRQFLNKDNSFCVDYTLDMVENMTWSSYYRGDLMRWASPSVLHASELMRTVYDNRELAFNIGKQARKDIEEKFNQETIARTLLGAIADVVARKRGMK
jgi:glycosyltransferase involved in cell wall biosynthesis